MEVTWHIPIDAGWSRWHRVLWHWGAVNGTAEAQLLPWQLQLHNPHPPGFLLHLLPSLRHWRRSGMGVVGGVCITSPCPLCPPPACNVTIHNRCKDTLPNCTKVKQKVSARRDR